MHNLPWVDACSVELNIQKRLLRISNGKDSQGASQIPPRATRKRNFVSFPFFCLVPCLVVRFCNIRLSINLNDTCLIFQEGMLAPLNLPHKKNHKEFPTGRVLRGASETPPRAARKRNFALFSFWRQVQLFVIHFFLSLVIYEYSFTIVCLLSGRWVNALLVGWSVGRFLEFSRQFCFAYLATWVYTWKILICN